MTDEIPADRWEREKNIQNDYLRSQMAALSKATPKDRRRYQILVVRCGGCGDVLVEILELVPYAVILHRRTQDHPDTAHLPVFATVNKRIEHMRTRLEPIRLDKNWMFVPINWPLRDDDTGGDDPSVSLFGHFQLIPCACRCRSIDLSKRLLYDTIRSGKKTLTIARNAEE